MTGRAARRQPPRKENSMPERYKAVPETTKKRSLVYVVIDTATNKWMHVYDCFLWAEDKAREMNEKQKRMEDKT